MKKSLNRSDNTKHNSMFVGKVLGGNNVASRAALLRTNSNNSQSEILSAKAITTLAENLKNFNPSPPSHTPLNTFDDELEDRLIQIEKMAKELYNEKPPVERFSKKFLEMKDYIDKEIDSRVLRIESLDTNISMLKNEVNYTNKLVERFARGLEKCLEKHPLMIPDDHNENSINNDADE